MLYSIREILQARLIPASETTLYKQTYSKNVCALSDNICLSHDLKSALVEGSKRFFLFAEFIDLFAAMNHFPFFTHLPVI